MIGIVSSKTRHLYERPPDFPWAFNEDSAQAQALFAWFPLGYESATERDAGPSGKYEMTVKSGTTLVSDPDGGLVRRFDRGTADYVRTGDMPVDFITMPLSMTCWCRPDDLSTSMFAMCIGDKDATAGTRFWGLGITSSDFAVAASQSASGPSSATATKVCVVNRVHMIGAVFATGTDRRAYVDGGFKGTNTGSESPTGVDWIAIGAQVQSTIGAPFGGRIWDARVYKRILEDSDMDAIYCPSTRWELYYPIGRKTWSFAPGGAPPSVNRRRRLICGAAA